VADTILIINTIGDTTAMVGRYAENPYPNVAFPAYSIDKYIEISIEDETQINWPVLIKIYYTNNDLINSNLDEEQLIGLFYLNEETEVWELYESNGVNTTNQNGYAGYIWANSYHFTTIAPFGDSAPPEIKAVNDAPDPQDAGGNVFISCQVNDNIEVSNVMVNITHNTSSINISMDNIPDTDYYYYDANYTSLGIYYYSIWTIDVYGNENSTEKMDFTIVEKNDPPYRLGETYPNDGGIGIERPPFQLNVSIEDPDNDTMDVYIRWRKHDYYHFGEWVTLQTYTGVGNGTYNFIPPDENDWIWGNTTYTWSVNITDGLHCTNETYQYTTKGSRYDVSNNDIVNFQDAGLVWIHRDGEADYDGIYDVTNNGEINFMDAGKTWINRD